MSFEATLTNVAFSHAVSCYRSKTTGLQVINQQKHNLFSIFQVAFADTPGPFCSTFITVRTESFDCQGIPHILEHLVFLGSKRWPLIGTLDLASQMGVSNGVNAWTRKDHTTFTMNVANQHSLPFLLPLYLDHIFSPCLKDEYFYSEVHGVTEENGDVGVVYCEVSATKYTEFYEGVYEVEKLLYPGRNAYGGTDSGGTPAGIRSKCLDMDLIRAYHKKYYRPDNVIVLVCGPILNKDAILNALSVFDGTLKIEACASLKPFSCSLDSLVAATSSIPFLCNETDLCSVAVGFRLPGLKTGKFLISLEMWVLCYYLYEGPSSPLVLALVDRNLVADISVRHIRYAEESVVFVLSGVRLEDASAIETEFLRILSDAAKEINFVRLKRCISDCHEELLLSFEENPADLFQEAFSSIFLYSDVASGFPLVLDGERSHLRYLLKELESDGVERWENIMRNVLVEAPHVSVISYPSRDLRARLNEEEEERLKVRASCENLREHQAKLDLARNESERSRATCLTLKAYDSNFRSRSIAVPLFKAIQFGVCGSLCPPDDEMMKQHFQVLSDLPFTFFRANYTKKSAFVNLKLSSPVDNVDHREFLPLLCEILFRLPIQDMSVADVYEALRNDMICESAKIGLLGTGGVFQAGKWPNFLTLACIAKVEKYCEAVEWLRRCLFDSDVTVDRLKVGVSALIVKAYSSFRQENEVLSSSMNVILYKRDSTIFQCSITAQLEFLLNFQKMLDVFPEKAVASFKSFFLQVQLAFQNVWVFVEADMEKIVDVGLPWKKWQLRSSLNLHKSCSASLKKSSDVRKSHLIRVDVNAFSLCECWSGPDFQALEQVPALKVLLAFIDTHEGILWKAVRNGGLAYGANLRLMEESGTMELRIIRSSTFADVMAAREMCVKAIEGLQIMDLFDWSALELAKSVALSSIMSNSKSHFQASEEDWNDVLKGYSSSWLVEKISKCDVSDVYAAHAKMCNDMKDWLQVVVVPANKNEVQM